MRWPYYAVKIVRGCAAMNGYEDRVATGSGYQNYVCKLTLVTATAVWMTAMGPGMS